MGAPDPMGRANVLVSLPSMGGMALAARHVWEAREDPRPTKTGNALARLDR